MAAFCNYPSDSSFFEAAPDIDQRRGVLRLEALQSESGSVGLDPRAIHVDSKVGRLRCDVLQSESGAVGLDPRAIHVDSNVGRLHSDVLQSEGGAVGIDARAIHIDSKCIGRCRSISPPVQKQTLSEVSGAMRTFGCPIPMGRLRRTQSMPPSPSYNTLSPRQQCNFAVRAAQYAMLLGRPAISEDVNKIAVRSPRPEWNKCHHLGKSLIEDDSICLNPALGKLWGDDGFLPVGKQKWNKKALHTRSHSVDHRVESNVIWMHQTFDSPPRRRSAGNLLDNEKLAIPPAEIMLEEGLFLESFGLVHEDSLAPPTIAPPPMSTRRRSELLTSLMELTDSSRKGSKDLEDDVTTSPSTRRGSEISALSYASSAASSPPAPARCPNNMVKSKTTAHQRLHLGPQRGPKTIPAPKSLLAFRPAWDESVKVASPQKYEPLDAMGAMFRQQKENAGSVAQTDANFQLLTDEEARSRFESVNRRIPLKGKLKSLSSAKIKQLERIVNGKSYSLTPQFAVAMHNIVGASSAADALKLLEQ